MCIGLMQEGIIETVQTEVPLNERVSVVPLPARRNDNHSQHRKPVPHWRTWHTIDDIGWVSLEKYYEDLQNPPTNPSQQRGVNKYPCVLAYTRPKGIPGQYMIWMLFE